MEISAKRFLIVASGLLSRRMFLLNIFNRFSGSGIAKMLFIIWPERQHYLIKTVFCILYGGCILFTMKISHSIHWRSFYWTILVIFYPSCHINVLLIYRKSFNLVTSYEILKYFRKREPNYHPIYYNFIAWITCSLSVTCKLHLLIFSILSNTHDVWFNNKMKRRRLQGISFSFYSRFIYILHQIWTERTHDDSDKLG